MSKICNDLCKIFEKELCRRLHTKSCQYASETILLLSAFKFYDNLNTGYVNKTQWIHSFERVGLTGFSNQDLGFLFDYYDNNQTGLINYKQFTLFLLNPNNHMAPHIPQSPLIVQTQTKSYFNQLLDRFRVKVNTNGGLTYYLLLDRMYKSSYRMIHFDTLNTCLRDLNIPTGIRDLKDFFALVDANESGWVGIDQIMKIIRGRMSPVRNNAVRRCFEILDKGRRGYVDIEELMGLFQSNEDIEVKNARKNDREIYGKFKTMIEIYCEWKGIRRLVMEDFLEYYEAVSASIDSDEYFIELVESDWILKELHTTLQDNYMNMNQRYGKMNEDINMVNNSNNNKVNPIAFNRYDGPRKTPLTAVYDQETKPRLFNSSNSQRTPTPLNIQNQSQYKRTPIRNINPMTMSMRQDPNTSLQFPQVDQPLSQSIQLKNNTPFNQYIKKGHSPYLIKNQRTPIFQEKEIPDTYYNPINNTMNLPENQPRLRPTPKLSQSHQRSMSQPSIQGVPLLANYNPSNYAQPHHTIEQQTPGIGIGVNIQSKAMKNMIDELSTNSMKKIKDIISSRGEKGVFGLQRMFTGYDRNKTKQIGLNDWIDLCNGYRLNLTQDEIEALYSKYAPDNSSYMSYDDFVSELIGQMNMNRQNIIRRLYIKLDPKGVGSINIDDLKGDYNASRHPDVIEGRKTQNEIEGEWLDCIEAFCMYYDLPMSNRPMSMDELFAFYSEISLTIMDDRYFEYMISNVWDMVQQHYSKRRDIYWN